VPVRFVPPDVLPSADGVIGARTSASVAAGGYLTASLFEGESQRETGALRRGERKVTVDVVGGSALAGLRPGARVDVLVSTETGAGGGRTTMALAGADLLSVEAGGAGGYQGADPGADSGDIRSGPTAVATLRVSLEQAIYLTAADNFAREIRLLPRPRGDHSRAGHVVTQAQLY
jgi:pilus assembly protein CpaB